MMRFYNAFLALLLGIGLPGIAVAQDPHPHNQHHQQNHVADSMYIEEVEQATRVDKVLHAEPLYIDLIRDLGARRGEREWNVGLGMTDEGAVDHYETLVEYEWAPIDRLGLEIELPFSFYGLNGSIRPDAADTDNQPEPGHALESLKLATQWSFFVNERLKTSMAIGYLHEFELEAFAHWKNGKWFHGTLFNPFGVVAKRWGNNLHTLMLGGARIFVPHQNGPTHITHTLNTSLHYMISGTRNFVGIEVGKTIQNGEFDIVLRPQMRVSLADLLIVGIVSQIPVSRQDQRLGVFLRLIYEPGFHSH